MTDIDWLTAVAAAPDDPLTRLAYADWLDDRGDPRGEQLRLDVQLAALADDDPAAGPLRRRLAELVPGTDARWRAIACRVPVEAGEPFQHPRRHPLNVGGPWYTCGDCLACEAPEAVAPDLLAPLGGGMSTTHFVRQPQTPAEVERACQAARVCCVDDLRYGGTDPVVIRMLGNNPAWCDHLLPPAGRAVVPPSELYPNGVPPTLADRVQGPWLPAAAVPPPPADPSWWGGGVWAVFLGAVVVVQTVRVLLQHAFGGGP